MWLIIQSDDVDLKRKFIIEAVRMSYTYFQIFSNKKWLTGRIIKGNNPLLEWLSAKLIFLNCNNQ